MITTTSDAVPREPKQIVSWSLRGRTYVPVARGASLGRLDEDRADSMTDEGAPSPSEAETERRP
jgi:hypothetical protein